MSLGPPTPEKQTRRAARTRLLLFAGGKSSDLILLTEILSAILRGDVNGFHWGQPASTSNSISRPDQRKLDMPIVVKTRATSSDTDDA
jgi:hypothetical protein